MGNTSRRRSPLQAIRAFCLECEGDSPDNVKDCLNPACQFYVYRLGAPPKGQAHKPLPAIKEYCHDQCQAGSGREEVLSCKGDEPVYDVLQPCPVYPFRLGKNPNISAKTRERLRQVALLRDPLGLQTGKISQALARFDAPESHETDGAIVHPSWHENNTKNDRQTVISGGMENNHGYENE